MLEGDPRISLTKQAGKSILLETFEEQVIAFGCAELALFQQLCLLVEPVYQGVECLLVEDRNGSASLRVDALTALEGLAWDLAVSGSRVDGARDLRLQ